MSCSGLSCKEYCLTTIDDDVAEGLREPLDEVGVEPDQSHSCARGLLLCELSGNLLSQKASTETARSSSFVENSAGLCGIRLEKQESNVLVHGENKCEDLKNQCMDFKATFDTIHTTTQGR